MSEMVERVARAIERSTHNSDESLEESWATSENIRHNRRLEARAALAAMREPTEAMKDAGVVQDGYLVELAEYGPGDCGEIWRAMIDASLK